MTQRTVNLEKRVEKTLIIRYEHQSQIEIISFPPNTPGFDLWVVNWDKRIIVPIQVMFFSTPNGAKKMTVSNNTFFVVADQKENLRAYPARTAKRRMRKYHKGKLDVGMDDNDGRKLYPNGTDYIYHPINDFSRIDRALGI